MKTFLHVILFVLYCSVCSQAQITTPVIRANFGVDGDLRANYKDAAELVDNDDWFSHPGANGSGRSVIDTTGAAAIVARYATDMDFRRLPFMRSMNAAPFSVINNNVWIDAVFIRDYHNDDSTVFSAGSNKNGDSPANWGVPPSQSIPDKNDILDMMLHLRRAGPASTDSLWLMSGVSLDNTNGNRYFDFEMYQTDISFDRSTLKFTGYGPDAGHTSWEFDAAGNVTKAGDVIFSASYQNSALTSIEARIWINNASRFITPAAFDWNGSFDGVSNGAAYGYAGIRPKAAGTYYTGLASAATWAGPFGLIEGDETFKTDYSSNQYVEFSVNLSKLGLDGSGMLGNTACSMPFRRVLVKTRSSSSFTAELKDFVGPFDFFLGSRASLSTGTPLLCPGSMGKLEVINPVSGSEYTWQALSGNITTSPATGPEVWVDQAGTYIVTQTLAAGCPAYARDTIAVATMSGCVALAGNELYNEKGNAQHSSAVLKWNVRNNSLTGHFEIIRSSNGKDFEEAGKVAASKTFASDLAYTFTEPFPPREVFMYYRVILVNKDGSREISKIIPIAGSQTSAMLTVYPNPAHEVPQLQIGSARGNMARILVHRADGVLIHSQSSMLQTGTTTIRLNVLAGKPPGTYLVTVQTEEQAVSRKFILQ